MLRSDGALRTYGGLYGGKATLARTFGVVLSRLRRETCNHLVVVTANRHVWDSQVVKHFEIADQHAFPQTKIELHGMIREQARELIRHRLEDWRNPMSFDEFMGDGAWLDAAFPSDARERSVREIIRLCHTRWGSDRRKPTLDAIFQSYRVQLLSQAKGLDFDAGVIQRVVEQVLGPSLGVEVHAFNSPKGYLSVRWQAGSRREPSGSRKGTIGSAGRP